MKTRRPVPAARSYALPTLAVVLAAGVVVEGCLPDANAQTPPSSDAGVRSDVPHPRPHPRGGRAPVRPTPPQHPMNVRGGEGKVSPYK